MKPLRFETPVSISIWEGGETELTLVIMFTVSKHTPTSLAGPEEYLQVEMASARLFSKIKGQSATELSIPTWLDEVIDGDEDLRASLLSAWAEDQEDAKERAAEDRAEMLREDRP